MRLPAGSDLCARVLGDGRFNGFSICSVDNIYFFSAHEIMKRRNRSYTFPLHKFRCFWGGISNNLIIIIIKTKRAEHIRTELFLRKWYETLIPSFMCRHKGESQVLDSAVHVRTFKKTASVYFSLSSSNFGAMTLQGPHHVVE